MTFMKTKESAIFANKLDLLEGGLMFLIDHQDELMQIPIRKIKKVIDDWKAFNDWQLRHESIGVNWFSLRTLKEALDNELDKLNQIDQVTSKLDKK